MMKDNLLQAAATLLSGKLAGLPTMTMDTVQAQLVDLYRCVEAAKQRIDDEDSAEGVGAFVL